MRNRRDWCRNFLLLSWLLLILASCGKIEKAEDNVLTSGDATSLEAQLEIATVLENAQRAILGVFLPSGDVGIAGCKPEFSFVLVGIELKFAPSDTCMFLGDVNIKLFPLTAQVDLDVVGLKYVKAISFEADIQLDGSNTDMAIDFEILDGRISLGSLLPMSSLVLNGVVSFQNAASAFHLASRANAFEAITAAGVALVLQIDKDKVTGTSSRVVKGCFLMGGVPDDPNAGDISNCLTLGG